MAVKPILLQYCGHYMHKQSQTKSEFVSFSPFYFVSF